MATIVVPIFNAIYFIDECVRLLVEQTYCNIEIILVDDGSTDGSGELCKKWCDIDQRVRYLKKENGGPSSARNVGYSAASGEWVWFVDVDDCVKRDAVEMFLACTSEKNPDVVVCDFEIESHGNDLPRSSLDLLPFPEKLEDESKGLLKNVLSRAVGTYVWQFFIRKRLLDEDERHAPFNESLDLYEDVIFTLDIALKAKTVCYLDKRLYRYRFNPNSLVHSVNPSVAKQAIVALDYVMGLDVPRDMQSECMRMYCSLLLGLGMVAGQEACSRPAIDIIRRRLKEARNDPRYALIDFITRQKCLLARLGLYWKLRRLRDRLRSWRGDWFMHK